MRRGSVGRTVPWGSSWRPLPLMGQASFFGCRGGFFLSVGTAQGRGRFNFTISFCMRFCPRTLITLSLLEIFGIRDDDEQPRIPYYLPGFLIFFFFLKWNIVYWPLWFFFGRPESRIFCNFVVQIFPIGVIERTYFFLPSNRLHCRTVVIFLEL